MAAAEGAPSFDEIIKASRQRSKAEKLAGEIFGKGSRRDSAPQAGHRAKAGAGHSLASRISKVGHHYSLRVILTSC
jgi:hypothetical protein